ncbi:putative defensin-like protein 126 [Arabidopsis thaliana]
MSKSTFLFVYIILILGSMVNEIQGQYAMCHEILPETDCGAGSCTALCLQLWRGTGKCVRTNDQKLICLCNFECIV